MYSSAPNEFLLTDQVGSLRAVADTSGAIVKRIDYDSFGNIIADTNPAFAVPFGFAGGLHDRDTGLVRFGARDYDPAIGRFAAKDPIDFAGGDTNLYAYVVNDPVSRLDPLGLHDTSYWHSHSHKDSEDYAVSYPFYTVYNQPYENLPTVAQESVEYHESIHRNALCLVPERTVLRKEIKYIREQLRTLDSWNPFRDTLKEWLRRNEDYFQGRYGARP